ncbi:esterase/lipase family protein [Novosphingobium mangrovi (ex Huang et al. 2023)]|uniref:Alpha/beta fold hydrolase n=1 Tax=Novosphingobium mangrovi (ex Huang et al. 2023) TaxID=2976432 RepID=A0ABT2HZZ7_9SPHN|nr:alpha/beta fold hydrolase [Novosphingobium mangrovi (ex Huang et al. 2023)]MCT2398118.1 alpha/beta fold hydrolase [Novosphingobium mangrovi (ex Huang et al. 2023)]
MNDTVRQPTGSLREAIARRAAFVREPHPKGVAKPPLQLMLAELLSLYRGRNKGPDVRPAAHPLPVMLLPGFGSHPRRMKPMADALTAAGHHVHEWGLGFNLGPNPANFAFLMRRVGAIAREHKAPVALVGWSLGGLFAREIARREPQMVAKVITMGTPFSGDPRANNAWKAYQVVTGHSVDTPPIECDFSVKPPVPTIALWSPRDGIVAPRAACGWPEERDRAVSVRCSHLDFASASRVVAEVLRQLDRED